MAGLWIAIGCVLIVALLFFALLLPRPGAELDVAELPFHVGSSRLGSSRHAMMKSDPAEEDQGGPRVGTREDEQDIPSGSEGAGDERGSPGGSESDQKGAAAGKEGEQGGSDQGSQGQEGSSSAGSEEGRRDSQSGSESQQQAGSQSQGEEGSSSSDSKAPQESSRSSSEEGDRDSRSKSEGDRQGDRSARDEQGRGAKSESRSSEDEEGRRSRPDSKQAESEKDGGRSRSEEADERRESESESSGGGGWRESDRGDEAEEPDSETAEDGGTADQGDGRPWFDPAALTSSAASWFGTVLKWIFYGVILLVVGYWLWRSRADLLAAARNFFQELRDFWRRLFGGRAGAADQAADSGEGPQTPTHRPFAAFPDPFASGMADRCSPDELVRYTFAALEAWAREHGWARGPDQTPHEFAQDLGTRVHALSQDVRRLADLYCRVAYARESVPRKSVAPLKQLWQELRHREPVSV